MSALSQYYGECTIELYKNDELLGTKSHTYNFNMEFPEGTLTLGNDFLSSGTGLALSGGSGFNSNSIKKQ